MSLIRYGYMSNRAEIYLKLLAISNMLMAMIALPLLLRWPLAGSRSSFSGTFITFLAFIFFTDLILTRNFFNLMANQLPELFTARRRWIIRTYYFLSFISRSLAILEGGYVVYVISGASMSILFSSLLFAYIINIIKKSPYGVEVRGSLTILITLNLMMLVYLAIPFVTTILIFDINIVYYVVFAIGGLFKGLSYLIGSFTYYRWSSKLLLEADQDEDTLYPIEEEHEEDLRWPT